MKRKCSSRVPTVQSNLSVSVSQTGTSNHNNNPTREPNTQQSETREHRIRQRVSISSMIRPPTTMGFDHLPMTATVPVNWSDRPIPIIERLPKDIQILLAQAIHPKEIIMLSNTNRTLQMVYNDNDRVWRHYCLTDKIHTAEIDGNTKQPNTQTTMDYKKLYPAFQLDTNKHEVSCGMLHSSVPLDPSYLYLIPNVGEQFGGQPRGRLVLPRATVLPNVRPATSWKKVFRELHNMSRLKRLPITSLLLPSKLPGQHSAIACSSADHTTQSVEATIKISTGSNPVSAPFWSSTGSVERRKPAPPRFSEDEGESADEWLTYQSHQFPIAYMTRLRVKNYQCYYQKGEPIYPPSWLRMRIGWDTNVGQYHYTSPWFPVLPVAEFQDFFFYDPEQYESIDRPGPLMLVCGNTLKIELRGYNTLQPGMGESLYYMVLSAVELEGLPLDRHLSMPKGPSQPQPPLVASLMLMDRFVQTHSHELSTKSSAAAVSPDDMIDVAPPPSTSPMLFRATPSQVASLPIPTFEELLILMGEAFGARSSLQSCADMCVERDLLSEVDRLLLTANWKKLGQLVVSSTSATPQPEGEQGYLHEDEADGEGDQDEDGEAEEHEVDGGDHEEDDPEGEEAHADQEATEEKESVEPEHLAAATPVHQQTASPSPVSSSTTAAPTPSAVISLEATHAAAVAANQSKPLHLRNPFLKHGRVPGRILMYRRLRDTILEGVIWRSRQLTQESMNYSAASSPLAGATIPMEAQSRSHCLAVATYLVQLLSRFVRLTEFESYILCLVDGLVKGLLEPALQNGALSFSLRIGEIFMIRQQYGLAAQMFAQARIFGKSVEALAHSRRHFPQLMTTVEYVSQSQGITHEDVLRMIMTIHCPGGVDPSANDELPSDLRTPLEFAHRCVELKDGFGDPIIPIDTVFEILGLRTDRAAGNPVGYIAAQLAKLNLRHVDAMIEQQTQIEANTVVAAAGATCDAVGAEDAVEVDLDSEHEHEDVEDDI